MYTLMEVGSGSHDLANYVIGCNVRAYRNSAAVRYDYTIGLYDTGLIYTDLPCSCQFHSTAQRSAAQHSVAQQYERPLVAKELFRCEIPRTTQPCLLTRGRFTLTTRNSTTLEEAVALKFPISSIFASYAWLIKIR